MSLNPLSMRVKSKTMSQIPNIVHYFEQGPVHYVETRVSFEMHIEYPSLPY